MNQSLFHFLIGKIRNVHAKIPNKPWYSGRFKGIEDIVTYWKTNYTDLRAKSDLFKKSFYNTSLPDEVTEAIAANLTILKSPTVLRQPDGKLWSWEGCGDNSGCCSVFSSYVFCLLSYLFNSRVTYKSNLFTVRRPGRYVHCSLSAIEIGYNFWFPTCDRH